MASLPFPNSGSELVVLPNGRPAAGAKIYIYQDVALTIPAEIYYDVAGAKGPPVPLDSGGFRALTLDAYGRQPRYWGPANAQDQLWVLANGVASRVDADYDPRLDFLTAQNADLLARLQALENGTGPVNPGNPGFTYVNGVLLADTTAPGISYVNGVLTIDDAVAAGVSYSNGVLLVTTAN